MLNSKPTEYDLFVSYGRAVKTFLQSSMHLSRYPEEENVKVEYASQSRAFVKFLVPVINGGNLNPTVTFYAETPEIIENEQLLGFVYEKKKISDTNVKLVPPPIVCKLSYKVTIMTATAIDADRLAYQLVSVARKNHKVVLMVDGQWAEIYCSTPTEEGPAEPGEADRVVKKSVMLTIARAYLPVDFYETFYINNINMAFDEMDEEINEG